MKNIFGKFAPFFAAVALIALAAMSSSCTESKSGPADELVGNWQVTDEWFRINDNMYKNDHVVTIEKINGKRVRMINFTNVAAQQSPTAPIKNPGDVVEADVEMNEKGELLLYISQNYVLNPTWDHLGKSRTELWPVIYLEEGWARNRDMSFPPQYFTPNDEGKLMCRWSTGGKTVSAMDQSRIPLNAMVAFIDAQTGVMNGGAVIVLCGTVWTKI